MKSKKLVISESAREDLVDIWVYVAEDSPRQADRFLDMLHAKCELLAETPGIGRIREKLAPGIRSFPIERYQILYRVTEREVQIVRVVSGYRDLDALF